MTEKELLIQFLNKLQLKGGENLSGYFEICNDEGGFIEEITFPSLSAQYKIDYVLKAYDDDCRLINNKNIYIIDYGSKL